MSLEFGLVLTGLGILAMFSALMFIIITCEVLKRIFREKEVETIKAEGSVEEIPSERKRESTRA